QQQRRRMQAAAQTILMTMVPLCSTPTTMRSLPSMTAMWTAWATSRTSSTSASWPTQAPRAMPRRNAARCLAPRRMTTMTSPWTT
ncbi:hypothetical protein IWQ57_006127, partial [Coemansia nantahalensis]